MLVDIEGHTVPHFKAPVYAKVELECGRIFSIQTSLLDTSHLLHKTGFVKTESVGTVHMYLHTIQGPRNVFDRTGTRCIIFRGFFAKYELPANKRYVVFW